MPSTIRRQFGIIDDPLAASGGSSLDNLMTTAGDYAAAGAAIAAPTTFWPATGGTIDPGLDRIDRTAEVRGRRAASPPVPFRAAPVLTIPFPAYRSMIEKLAKKTLGGVDTVTGSAAAGYTHTIAPLGFGTSAAPAVLPLLCAQMVRDDLVHALGGCAVNRLTLSFPLDGEGTGEMELHPLYYDDIESDPPAASFTDVNDVLALRDAQVVLDSGPTALTTPTAPTGVGSTTGGTLPAGSYQYSIVAYNSNGSTVAGPASTTVTTTGATSSVTLTWTAVTGALGYRVYGRAAGNQKLIADVAGNLSFLDTGAITPTALPPTTNTTGGAIPDLIAFDFSFVNNVIKKWYAKRNVARFIAGQGTNARTSRLWFPTEHKLGAEQDVTFALEFGNTNTAQDFLRDYAAIQQIVFNVIGGPVPGSNPTVYESVQITLYNAVAGPAAGPGALAARGDTTYRVEGNAFYSNAAANDVQFQVINSASAALT